MLAPERTALILLAAGRSLRFTDADKLAEPFLDKPLAFHVVTALENIPFLTRIAVVSDTCLDFAERGYRVEANPDPSLGRDRCATACRWRARRVPMPFWSRWPICRG
jgi:molybdenum cofactor cytidylyltransferase